MNTIMMKNPPTVAFFAAAVGRMEGDGPYGRYFDSVSDDVSLGQESWEKAESALQKKAMELALKKGNLKPCDIDFIFAGDLLNQCTSSTYGLRDFNIPFIGIYGACSTMAESIMLASIFVDNGLGKHVAAITSSHYCSAERQFRFPVNYGGQRPPTAQWTATGSGAAVLTPHGAPPYVRAVTVGRITDMGIKDANNMGAAMAGAAYETISSHLKNTQQKPSDFDLILTGDLGFIGSDILVELFSKDDIDLSKVHNDCGKMIYDRERQDVHGGGSGCGCSASIMCGHILKELQKGTIKHILFTATGALMSPTEIQQGESIPGIAHAVELTC